MERPTPRQVTDWLIELAKLVAPGRNAELGEAIRAYAPLLVERFISRDFNASSRAYVAERCKFWPSYGELCELLDKWPRPAERPATSQPDLDDERLTDDDRMCIAWWNKRVAEGASQAKLDSLASIIRARSSRAWEHIRQPEPDKPAQPSDAEKGAVQAIVAAFTAERRANSRPFPEHRKPPPDVTLKGDALRASREARGLRLPPEAA